MTRTAIRNAFRKMDSTEQAIVLKDLATALAESLSDEDRTDVQVFEQRQHAEPEAGSWSDVRAKVDVRCRRKRVAVNE